MKIAWMVGLLGMAASGCTTALGTSCSKKSDCSGKGQVCVDKICTHTCNAQAGPTGCPVNYDCTVSDATIGTTCNKIKYKVDAQGNPIMFGLDCSLNDGACAAAGDIAPNPQCRKGPDFSNNPPTPLAQDPHAYCTGTCSTDTDCPVAFQCLKDYDNTTKCLKRTFCSACAINDDCSGEFNVCVPDKGTGHYCTKKCANDADCGGPQDGFLKCRAGADALGNSGMYCLHLYGACTGAGEICDPCRTDADCKPTSSCITNDATHESFCSRKCSTDSDCTSPNPTGCDNIQPVGPNDPSPNNICVGNSVYVGVVACWY